MTQRLNLSIKTSERLEKAHDTLELSRNSIKEIKRNLPSLRDYWDSFGPRYRDKMERKLKEDMKILNNSVQAALSVAYHVN